jgi:hypothetical protein
VQPWFISCLVVRRCGDARVVVRLGWPTDWLFCPCGIGMRRVGNGANDIPKLPLSHAVAGQCCAVSEQSYQFQLQAWLGFVTLINC